MRAVTLFFAILSALLIIGCTGARPPHLGLKDGMLAPCPSSPNCVSSRSTDNEHAIGPFAYSGEAKEALARLAAIVRDMPRTKIISATDSYLYAEFTSLIFRFVDDVEFAIDEQAKVIHVRSASRVGRSDLGVNRKRMENIRKAWKEAAHSRKEPVSI